MPMAWSWRGAGSGWTFPSQRDHTPPPWVSTWVGPPMVVEVRAVPAAVITTNVVVPNEGTNVVVPNEGMTVVPNEGMNVVPNEGTNEDMTATMTGTPTDHTGKGPHLLTIVAGHTDRGLGLTRHATIEGIVRQCSCFTEDEWSGDGREVVEIRNLKTKCQLHRHLHVIDGW